MFNRMFFVLWINIDLLVADVFRSKRLREVCDAFLSTSCAGMAALSDLRGNGALLGSGTASAVAQVHRYSWFPNLIRTINRK
jgi:hypothetical protein